MCFQLTHKVKLLFIAKKAPKTKGQREERQTCVAVCLSAECNLLDVVCCATGLAADQAAQEKANKNKSEHEDSNNV